VAGPRTRYRDEEGRACIDIRLRTARQLFDGRDPAPFRERDLDPAAVAHLLDCARVIKKARPIKIVLTFAEPFAASGMLDDADIRDAIRAQFEHERDLVQRKLSANFRHGQLLAVLGFAVLALFLTLAEVTQTALPEGTLRRLIHEGLTITGWVAMWRPAETLLYDWWPLIEERRRVDRILEAPIDVKFAPASVVPMKD
jgi:hypothetical protein